MPRRSDSADDIQIGKRVRFYRLKANLSQTDLANEFGISFQQVQKYEKGTNRIASSRLMTMAKLLKVDVMDLLGKDNHSTGNSFDVGLMDTPKRQRIVELLLKRNDERIEDIIIDLLKTHRPWNHRQKPPGE